MTNLTGEDSIDQIQARLELFIGHARPPSHGKVGQELFISWFHQNLLSVSNNG